MADKDKHAKLVARGDQQRADIDFGELFAPTFFVPFVRLLAAMAFELGLDLCHFEVEQAFVQSPLGEDVYTYMQLPEGCGWLSGMVVKVKKRLYGLKQASRQWHAHLTRSFAIFRISAVVGGRVCFLVDGRRKKR